MTIVLNTNKIRQLVIRLVIGTENIQIVDHNAPIKDSFLIILRS